MMSSTGVMPPLIFGRKAYPKGSAKSSLQNEDHGPARALPRFAAPAVRAGTPGEAPLPAPRFFPTLRGHVAIHSRSIRRLTDKDSNVLRGKTAHESAVAIRKPAGAGNGYRLRDRRIGGVRIALP